MFYKKTSDIIQQMEKEFDEKFEEAPMDRYGNFRYTRKNIKSFMKFYIRTLLESFGEEIIAVGGNEEKYKVYKFEKNKPYDVHESLDMFLKIEREYGKKLLQKEQRLKMKEIIEEVGK